MNKKILLALTAMSLCFCVGVSYGQASHAQKALDHLNIALKEAEQAAAEVVQGERGEVDLAPQNSYIRMLQHQLAERFSLKSQSTGKEPNRHVKIFNG